MNLTQLLTILISLHAFHFFLRIVGIGPISFYSGDDQSWKDYGFMGSEVVIPHIDALAENGLTFKRGYVAAPTYATLLGIDGDRSFPTSMGSLEMMFLKLIIVPNWIFHFVRHSTKSRVLSRS